MNSEVMYSCYWGDQQVYTLINIYLFQENYQHIFTLTLKSIQQSCCPGIDGCEWIHIRAYKPVWEVSSIYSESKPIMLFMVHMSISIWLTVKVGKSYMTTNFRKMYFAVFWQLTHKIWNILFWNMLELPADINKNELRRNLVLTAT